MSDRIRIREASRDHDLRQSERTWRLAFPAPADKGFSARRVLLIGTGALAGDAVNELATDGESVYIVGAVDSNPVGTWRSRHPGIPILGRPEDLRAVAGAYCADEICVALPMDIDGETLTSIEDAGRELGVPVVRYLPPTVSPEPPRQTAKAMRTAIRRSDHPSNRGMRGLVKRSLDVLVSGAALLLLSPLLAVIAVAIKLTSAGPVLFHQQRIGRRRRQFQMLKFRTMLKNAEDLRVRMRQHNNARGILFKIFDDPRVTRVGSVLRRTSLDELPQLFNVFMGEMSLVGPRPIPVWVAEQMHGPAYLRRFSVRQGLTGLWQVEGRQQDFDYMASQDIRYVETWSLALDLKILFKTLPAMIRGEGAH
jgi:exopolysaccharide biosynthesis polyprenyl glycosylphosphotransferase